MSAPHTNLDKQRRRHRGPMIGMAAVLLFVALVALGAFIWPGLPLDGQAAPDGEPRPAVEEGAADDTQ
jgi:NhaP-type Na+/H+ or K+/H+ antiporter